MWFASSLIARGAAVAAAAAARPWHVVRPRMCARALAACAHAAVSPPVRHATQARARVAHSVGAATSRRSATTSASEAPRGALGAGESASLAAAAPSLSRAAADAGHTLTDAAVVTSAAAAVPPRDRLRDALRLATVLLAAVATGAFVAGSGSGSSPATHILQALSSKKNALDVNLLCAALASERVTQLLGECFAGDEGGAKEVRAHLKMYAKYAGAVGVWFGFLGEVTRSYPRSLVDRWLYALSPRKQAIVSALPEPLAVDMWLVAAHRFAEAAATHALRGETLDDVVQRLRGETPAPWWPVALWRWLRGAQGRPREYLRSDVMESAQRVLRMFEVGSVTLLPWLRSPWVRQQVLDAALSPTEALVFDLVTVALVLVVRAPERAPEVQATLEVYKRECGSWRTFELLRATQHMVACVVHELAPAGCYKADDDYYVPRRVEALGALEYIPNSKLLVPLVKGAVEIVHNTLTMVNDV